MPRAYRRADAVIAVSRHAAKELMLRAGLDDSRVWIVPNGADRLPVRPARRPRTPRRLLYVGALARYKRLNVAIEALRLLRERREEYELTLVGEEWPGYGEIVIANARQAGVRDAVQWLGAVSDETLADLFASAHVSLNLSVCESFGIPTLEAMRAGVPVVVADEPWSAEVVASGGVRVAGDDPRAVADAIESLDDEHEWMRRAVDGRRIAERFTWRETARGVAQVCAEVSEREDKLKRKGPSRKRTDTP